MIFLDIFLELETKSGNTFKSFAGKGSFKYDIYKKKWFEWINCFIGPKYPAHGCLVYFKVKGTFIRVMGKGQRKFDDENNSFGSKPIRDGLKNNGWLVDDDPIWIEYECPQVRGPVAGTRIILEKIGDG